jgi:hypothetical protein
MTAPHAIACSATRARGVDAHRDPDPGELLYNGEHPPDLLVLVDPPSAGSSALALDVDDVGAVSRQRQSVVDGERVP